MTDNKYVPVFDSCIKDPFVNEEFVKLAAFINGALENLGLTSGPNGATPAEAGDINGNTVNVVPSDGNQAVEQGIRWRMGPWLLNADGNVKGGAVCRAQPVAANQSLFAPTGIDDCIWLEIESADDVTQWNIDCLKVKTRQHRFLVLINRGSSTFLLRHMQSQADPGVAYGFEFPNAQNYPLQGKQAIWLFQDPGSETWRPAAFSQPASVIGATWQFISSSSATGVANIDFTGLGAYSEILMFAVGVTISGAQGRFLLVSTDNGSTFLNSSGDYKAVDSDGVESNASSFQLNTGNTATALTNWATIGLFNQTRPKLIWTGQRATAAVSRVPTTSALNAVRYVAGGGATITGGTIYIYGR